MNVCPACGAANPTATIRCLGCDEPLDARPEPGAAGMAASLPPLPDGGLASAMPDWLRLARADDAASADNAARAPAPAETDAPNPYDPATFLTAEDLPAWLRALVAEPGEAGDDPLPAAASERHGAPPRVDRPHRSDRHLPSGRPRGMAEAIDVTSIDDVLSPLQRASRFQPGALAPGSTARPPVQSGGPTPDASQQAAGAVLDRPAPTSVTPIVEHGHEPIRDKPPAVRHGHDPLVPPGVTDTSVDRAPSVASRPHRRRGHVGAWLPALLLLLLIAAAALIVVQAMPGG